MPVDLLRRNPAFPRLVGAALVSQCGDWILVIGLAFHVYVETGSTMASGGLIAASVIPQIVLGSVTGVFVDRWDRRRTVVLTNLLMAAFASTLVLAEDRIWLVFPVLAAINVVETFFLPAEQSLVPLLVRPDDLVACNALNGQAVQVARLVGAAVGGVLAAQGGLVVVVAVDVASYLLAAALLRTLPPDRHEEPAEPPPALTGRLAAVVADWTDGVRQMNGDPTLRLLLVIAALTSIGEGIMGTLFLPYVRDVLHGTSTAYGAIVSLQAVGSIGAGVLLATVGARADPRTLFGVGFVIFGLLDLALFFYWIVLPDQMWPAFVIIVLVGLPVAAMVTGRTTLLQLGTHDRNRGRVFGALGALQGGGLVVGLLLAGVLGERFAVVPVLTLQGVLPIVAGLLALGLLPARSAVASAA